MQCEVCGNDYHKAFQVIIENEKRIFDSFECAIHALAPRCEHCGCPVIGHGVEVDDCIFCSNHCLTEEANAGRARDQVEVASEDSFPASDPPAWAAGQHSGAQVTSQHVETVQRRSRKPR
jgi:nitrite reductase/ring-hydroxylating ferredoxin subunit